MNSKWEKLWNGILLPKLFWSTARKKCSSDQEKLSKFEAEGREVAKITRTKITRTIYSNSERSEQFLVPECFFNLFLEVSQIWCIIKILIRKNNWDSEICRKSLKIIFAVFLHSINIPWAGSHVRSLWRISASLLYSTLTSKQKV